MLLWIPQFCTVLRFLIVSRLPDSGGLYLTREHKNFSWCHPVCTNILWLSKISRATFTATGHKVWPERVVHVYVQFRLVYFIILNHKCWICSREMEVTIKEHVLIWRKKTTKNWLIQPEGNKNQKELGQSQSQKYFKEEGEY